MEMVEAVRIQLEPLFDELLRLLNDRGNLYPLAYFSLLRQRLIDCRAEEHVLELFLELSGAAFQGFVLSPDEAAATDRLLATCEQISLTMTADGSH